MTTMHPASADEVLTEVERRLRDTEWSSHGEDRCRVALLHIDAYREGKAMAPDNTPPPTLGAHEAAVTMHSWNTTPPPTDDGWVQTGPNNWERTTVTPPPLRTHDGWKWAPLPPPSVCPECSSDDPRWLADCPINAADPWHQQ